ncbi:MAG TPA: CPBP family intramembrane glutamic endopeptidase [Planctomycetota bacterium]
MPPPAPRRTVSLRLLVVAFLAYSLAHLFNNTVLELRAPRLALQRLQIASGGWIEPLLVRSHVVLAAFVLVVVVLGRQRLAALGWRARNLVPGLLVYAGAWVVLQLGLMLAVLRRDGALELHPMWTSYGLPAVLGGVLAQLAGHALVEDTAFRGFFLPELRARLARPASLLALVVTTLALVGSSLLFGLAHVPTMLLVQGASLAELVTRQGHFLSAGLALGLAYLATRNLFAVVGLHVLLNRPAPIVDVPPPQLRLAVLIVFGGVIVLGFVHRLRLLRARREERRRAAAESEAERLSRRAA